MAVIFAIAVAGLMIGTAAAVAAAPPWWVTAAGAGIGAGIGSVGGPIGSIAGAMAGATLANLLYNVATKTSQATGSTVASYRSYAGTGFNASANSLAYINSELGTSANLTTTSYYFFAQAMESEVPAFLGNSTLNATYVGWDSGMYATADNLSRAAIQPVNSLLFQFFKWTEENSYPTAVMDGSPYSSIVGNKLTVGTLYFITPVSDFYFIQNSTAVFQNVNNNLTYTVGGSLPIDTVTGIANDGGTYVASAQPAWSPVAVQSGMPSGVYRLTSLSAPLNKLKGSTTWPVGYTTGYTAGPATLSAGVTATTDAISLTSQGMIAENYVSQTLLAVSIGSSANMLSAELGSTSGASDYGYATNGQTGEVSASLTQIQTIMSNAYSSANAFFQELKGLGYSNANQVPASLLVTLPSFYLPSSFLNGTFNATELQALYMAYLLQLKSWLNQTSGHTLRSNMTVNNATFSNGFVQVYGNLTVINGTHKAYYNDTWFLPLINIGTWTYKVKTWSNITNGTPDPNWLVTSGNSAGTLINLQDATFYTLGISVNGTATSSYTIKPVTIQYVLPRTASLGKFSNGGFFSGSQFGLPVWEWVAVVFVTALVIGIVYGAQKRRR